jgi:WhiB family redox-sensing transcriptional regulator
MHDLVEILMPPAWMQQAWCVGVDDVYFFPARGRPDLEKKAKALCAGCPVRERCLEHALEQGEVFGVWGGTSEQERRRLAKETGAS